MKEQKYHIYLTEQERSEVIKSLSLIHISEPTRRDFIA